MLLHPELAKSNKSAMFLSLLYKAMKADVSLTRIIAFTKRLLQVSDLDSNVYLGGPLLTCGAYQTLRSNLTWNLDSESASVPRFPSFSGKFSLENQV